MNWKLSILKKTGEVVALCYKTDCSEADSSLAKLLRNGYEEVTPIPISIVSRTEDSQPEFALLAIPPDNSVDICPPSQNLKTLNSGSPTPLYFDCYSVSGGNTRVRLTVKEGGNGIATKDIEVVCKNKRATETETVPAVPGGGKAAFMTGGKVDNLQMNGAKVDIVGNMTNYAPTEHRYQGDFKCDKRQTRNAQFMAEGVMNLNQKGVTNIQHVGKR